MYHLYHLKMTTSSYWNDTMDISYSDWFLLSPCLLHDYAPPSSTTEPEYYKNFFVFSQFITGLILYPIICILGIIGNILSIVVFSHRKITSTSVFLIALALADLLKLVNDVLYIIVSILFRTAPYTANRMLGIMYPFAHFVFNQSVCVCSWITVCVGIERYLLVCHIARAKELCTPRRARNISVFVFIVMSIISLPTAFRYTRVAIPIKVSNETQYDIMLTQFGCHPAYVSVYTWMMNLMRSLLPLCILTVINGCIIYAVRKQSAGKVVSSSRHRITLMLIVVILVFVVCLTPDAIMSTVFGFGYVEDGYLVKGLREYSDALVLLNSAVNFLIYCVCNSCFRETFTNLFLALRKPSIREEENARNGSQKSLMSLRATEHTYDKHGTNCKTNGKVETIPLKQIKNGHCRCPIEESSNGIS